MVPPKWISGEGENVVQDMISWPRPLYQEFPLKPYLFFVVFLDQEASEISYPGALPRGLDVRLIEADHFREGILWEQVQRDQPALGQKLQTIPKALVVQGEIANAQTLDYLHLTMEFLIYMVESGGEAVYDPFILSWWDGPDFLERATTGQIFNPFDHILLLNSPEPDGKAWLHTRGLRKFGRPELSVHGVGSDEFDAVKKMLDRFINFQALGGVIEEGREIQLEGLPQGYRPGPAQGDLDDPDYNNLHIEIACH